MNPDYLRFRGRIAQALDPRLHPIEWLDAQVWAGFAKVWASDDACLLTELKVYPTGAFEVHAMVAAGSLEGIDALREQAEEWGREMGAFCASCSSRKGWRRKLARHGYEVHQVYMRKAL